MRKIREVLRLREVAGLSRRAIARSLKTSPTTVGEYLRRARACGVTYAQAAALDEGALERRLFPSVAVLAQSRPQPDWAQVHRELRRKGVTLALLWEEYQATHPEGLRYSRFCERYREWVRRLDVVMRQEHRAGEKLFVDYAGQTVAVTERATGELRQAQVFVATLGASSYTYAEATWSQELADWTGSHVRAFAFFGGVPELVVPDNLKSAVSRACRYDPDTNPTYHDLARHYDVAVLPARVRRPRDKAKVEAGVQLVERWILAVLRHRTFFSLHELNTAIAGLRERLNTRAFRKLPGSRRTLFEQLDAPALRPLPATPYVFSQWKTVRVHIDYHVEFEGHYYSVPYQLARRQLQLRYTAETVELLHRGERVASHRRSALRGRHTTVAEHMPAAHRQVGAWTPQRLVRWAESIGPAAAALIAMVLRERAHPQQAYRACLGILRLGKSYGDARLEAACRRALTLGTHRYRSVASILARRLDEQPLTTTTDSTTTLAHENIRGAEYYH